MCQVWGRPIRDTLGLPRTSGLTHTTPAGPAEWVRTTAMSGHTPFAPDGISLFLGCSQPCMGRNLCIYSPGFSVVPQLLPPHLCLGDPAA